MPISNPGQPAFTQHVRWVFEGVPYDQEETYFVVRVPGIALDERGWTRYREGHHYRTPVVDNRQELRHTTEVLFPEDLADRLSALL